MKFRNWILDLLKKWFYIQAWIFLINLRQYIFASYCFRIIERAYCDWNSSVPWCAALRPKFLFEIWWPTDLYTIKSNFYIFSILICKWFIYIRSSIPSLYFLPYSLAHRSLDDLMKESREENREESTHGSKKSWNG